VREFLAAHAFEPAPDPALDRAERRAECGCHFDMAQLVHEAELQRTSLHLPQRGERLVRSAQLACARKQSFGVRRLARQGLAVDLLVAVGEPHALALTLPQAIQGAVTHDGRHPGHRRRHGRAVLGRMGPDLHVGVLHRLFGEVMPAQDAPCRGPQPRGCPAVQLRERTLIARGRRVEQPSEHVLVVGRPGRGPEGGLPGLSKERFDRLHVHSSFVFVIGRATPLAGSDPSALAPVLSRGQRAARPTRPGLVAADTRTGKRHDRVPSAALSAAPRRSG
jgi:diadenosine tetraphosphatase ApaH/serine/threonine PP2A family protein phosphatase